MRYGQRGHPGELRRTDSTKKKTPPRRGFLIGRATRPAAGDQLPLLSFSLPPSGGVTPSVLSRRPSLATIR